MLQNVKELILASASPRRRYLLEQLGLKFTIQPAAIDETHEQGESPEDYVLRMAAVKGESIARDHVSAWVLSADTTVIFENRTLGKPRSEEQALETLMLLSGQEHVVITAFCLVNHQTGFNHLDMVSTRVQFAAFDRELATAYIRTGEPTDKAGAYGIQGLGGVLVESVHGSYSNVIGLPLSEVVALLRKNDVITIS